MCLVLGASESFAISGGPWSGGTHVKLTGTYAGVFIPIPTVRSVGPPPVTLTDNSLALFTVKISREGIGTGTAVVFRNGFFYPGTIDATANPSSSTVSMLVQASFTKTHTEDDGNAVAHDYTFNFDAAGKFAKVSAAADQFAGVKLKGAGSLTFATENNPHNPDFARGDSGGPIQYKVRGFKQSETS